MAAGTILITARSFGINHPPHLDRLRAQGLDVIEYREGAGFSNERLKDLLPKVDGWVVSAAPVSAEMVAAADRLKVVVKHGVGVDNIDLPACEKAGVMVANAPGNNHVPVADLTITLMLGLGRRIIEAHQCVVDGKWNRFLGTGLSGRSVAVLGVGRIGGAVAERLRGFGCRIVGYDPVASPAIASRYPWIDFVDTLSRAISDVDYVSINLPLTPETDHLFNAETINLMRRGVLVVNTARGSIVDEPAMYDALRSGQVGGYGTDVFETEPPTGSPLLTAPNVLFTPHIASYTTDGMKALGDEVIANLLDGIAGRRPQACLTRSR